MEIIDKKEFTKTLLDKNIEAFIIYVTSFNLNSILIHSVQKTYIALLFIKKVQISYKYSDFSDIFLKKNTLILLKATKLN